jgi:hypothetical protein
MPKPIKITKKKVKEILKKLKRSGTYRFPFVDLYIYAGYRLIDLIENEHVVHYDELMYRFCEVGPGNRRFDPLTVDILINSDIYRKYFEKSAIKRKDQWFHKESGGLDIQFFKIKEKIFKVIKENSESKKLFELLKNTLEAIFEACGYTTESFLINENNKYLDFKLKSKKLGGELLLRFYNTNDRIYPDSWQLWDLFQKAHKEDCIPVLIASRIHGSCFPLFKALGIFARVTYCLFTDQSAEEIKNTVLNEDEKRLFSFKNISLCKINSMPGGSGNPVFEGVKQLLEVVVPGYFEAFKLRFDKTTKKIAPLLDGQFKYLLGSESSNLRTSERISRIENILTLKIGHLNIIRDLVKRHKNLNNKVGLLLKD